MEFTALKSRSLLLLAVLFLACIAANPTPYGPIHTDPSGGRCGYITSGPDASLGICVPLLGICKQDSDCPTDKPSGTGPGATPFCNLNPSSTGCLLRCTSDNECDVNNHGICEEHGYCTYIRSAPIGCNYVPAVSGKWVKIFSSAGPTTISFNVGTSHSYTTGSTDTTQWGTSATATASLGFSAFGASGSASVSGTISASVTAASTQSFTTMESSSTTKATTVPAGVVWQWQFSVQDGCGPSTVFAEDIAFSPNLPNPPCCLPGFFKDPAKPEGDCIDGPNLCNPHLAWSGTSSYNSTTTVTGNDAVVPFV